VTGLSTDWARAMGLEVPIVNAPMGGVAGGVLAAAVSRAGGLGMIGVGSGGSADQLQKELRHLATLDRPFGVGLIDWVLARQPVLLDVALSARPALVCVSFGVDWAWVPRVREAGCIAATQIGDLQEARDAVDGGVDLLIARGAEAGGHGKPAVGTLPLLAEVLDHVPVPVLAAGGISSGRALAAVLAAGASGAWLGTVLAASPEGMLSEMGRHCLIEATDADTVTTRAFDVVSGYPWPSTIPERVLANDFTAKWNGHVDDLVDNQDARRALATAIDAHDPRLAPVNAGQGVGQLTASRPVSEVIAELCRDARALLDRWNPPR
jgi:nitronate monooxygenase